jgi:hypothetical protein
LGTEGLPLVFKDVIPGPTLFPLAAVFVLYAEDLAFTLKVEIHGPVIDPVRPLLGEHFTADDTVGVFAHLDDPAPFHHDLAFFVLERHLGRGNGILRVEYRKVGQFQSDTVLLDELGFYEVTASDDRYGRIRRCSRYLLPYKSSNYP